MSDNIVKIDFDKGRKQVFEFPGEGSITLEVEDGDLTLSRATFMIELLKWHIMEMAVDAT